MYTSILGHFSVQLKWTTKSIVYNSLHHEDFPSQLPFRDFPICACKAVAPPSPICGFAFHFSMSCSPPRSRVDIFLLTTCQKVTSLPLITWALYHLTSTQEVAIVLQYILRGRVRERDLDRIHIAFIMVYYKFCFMIIVNNIFLCQTYELNFIICIYVWEKTGHTGFHIICNFRYLLGVLGISPCGWCGWITVIKILGICTNVWCRNVCNQGQNLSSSTVMMNVHWGHRYSFGKRWQWNRCRWSVGLRHFHVTARHTQRWSILYPSLLMME